MSCEIPWSLEGLFVARAALPSYSLLPTGGECQSRALDILKSKEKSPQAQNLISFPFTESFGLWK